MNSGHFDAPASPALQSTIRTAREMVISNARLILDNECITGSLLIRDGRIAAIHQGRTTTTGALDLGGDYLKPGLVELHTNNLERHMMPRPKPSFPVHPALLAHDAEIISAGITTVFDALGVGDPYGGGFRNNSQQEVLDLIAPLDGHEMLRADHLWHVRCALPAGNVRELFEPFIGNPPLRILSLMGHPPGQQQWTNLEHARTYYTGKKGWNNERFDQELLIAPQWQAEFAMPNRRYFCDYAQLSGIALASHDDTTPEHVDQAFDEGASICELPTTMVAARRAREQKLA